MSPACADDESPAKNGDVVIISTLPALTPTSPPAPSVTPNSAAALRGFIFPITGACLPRSDQLMPNAPRAYRNGTHEGVDFYAVDNCTAISVGTPVIAAKAGRVIRADLDYRNPTSAEMSSYLANPNTEDSIDKFRGRQVWVDHGNGIVSRYCHLSGIASGITVGSVVTQAQLIAYVGESGTPESLSNPGSEYHLHFELRVNGGYLGSGLPASQMRLLYGELFSP